MNRSSNIGGQAVLEGIMMRNGDNYAIAVRRSSGEIVCKAEPYQSIIKNKKLLKIPILRGGISFIDSLVSGTKALMWSSAYFGEEEEPEEEKNSGAGEGKDTAGKGKEAEPEGALGKGAIAASVALALVFTVGLFILLPYFLASLVRGLGASEVIVSLAEALLRVTIFLLYMLLISRMKDIQRVFAYHGAEHKCINCIENGLDLTVENVAKSSRQHRRCGTSFLLLVVVISVVFFLLLGLLGLRSPLLRLAVRLLMIPLIAGVAYEFLRLAGRSDNCIVGILAAPGMALQRLVTREPDEAMIAVAITAVEAVFDWRAWQGKAPAPEDGTEEKEG